MKPVFVTMMQLIFALLIGGSAEIAQGQQYNYNQGYVFNQKYVQRIDLAKGEELIGEAGSIEKFRMPYDWERDNKDSPMPTGVSRHHGRLVFKFKSRPELSLSDFTIKPGEKAPEGEWQRFIYLHSFANYHLVGISFMHDEPGFLLIEKSGAKIYFVDHP